jgi:UDP-N-acetylmuramoyl-tripeptide--D-alanyl-D-alanine ligase
VHVSRASDADDAARVLARMLRPGDAVLVKASNSVGLARVIERVSGELEPCST